MIQRRSSRVRMLEPVRAVDPRINVTPLVDVVLVLLIIFMVLTPLVDAELPVELASARRTVVAAEVAPTQIVVSLAGADALTIDGTPVASAGYVDALRALLATRTADARTVFVIASDDARYPRVVAALEGAARAGAARVALAVDPVTTAPP